MCNYISLHDATELNLEEPPVSSREEVTVYLGRQITPVLSLTDSFVRGFAPVFGVEPQQLLQFIPPQFIKMVNMMCELGIPFQGELQKLFDQTVLARSEQLQVACVPSVQALKAKEARIALYRAQAERHYLTDPANRARRCEIDRQILIGYKGFVTDQENTLITQYWDSMSHGDAGIPFLPPFTFEPFDCETSNLVEQAKFISTQLDGAMRAILQKLRETRDACQNSEQEVICDYQLLLTECRMISIVNSTKRALFTPYMKELQVAAEKEVRWSEEMTALSVELNVPSYQMLIAQYSKTIQKLKKHDDDAGIQEHIQKYEQTIAECEAKIKEIYSNPQKKRILQKLSQDLQELNCYIPVETSFEQKMLQLQSEVTSQSLVPSCSPDITVNLDTIDPIAYFEQQILKKDLEALAIVKII